MQAEVISIGDELTSGQRLDTNSQWLSQRLGELGIRVLFHTTVADDLEANVRVLREAAGRADLVIATGGMGPTADDLTREALARANGVELVLDAESLAQIRDLFARRKRAMPEQNVVQAMFPAGSRPIPNPHGTAPGIDMEIARAGRGPCRVFALPGVPAEMREMWQATVAASIERMERGAKVIRHRRLKCFGAGESHLESMLPDLIRRGREPSVGITVSEATITLRITAEGASPEACEAAIEPTVATIRQCLGTLVFGEEDDELEDAVLRLLARWNETLATVEWGTAGVVASCLGRAAKFGGHYLGGLVVSNESLLAGLLDIPGETLARYSTSSVEAVEMMATNCRRRFGADYALAVGPFPKFDPQRSEPEQLFLALAAREGTTIKAVPFAAHPEILLPLSSKQAMNMVRLALLGREAGKAT
ncbi:MAG: CinA family nicotinamide mononucleotide deamidase-related protein [Pirellulales bacterium]